MLMDVWGQCSDHEPPHVVDLNTTISGGEFPPVSCGGTVTVYEVTGQCDECGEDVSGEYFPDEYPYMPTHQCAESGADS